MNVNLLDEVPFSKDYNVDSLTDWETQEILDAVNSWDKDHKKRIIHIAVWTILLAIFLGFILWNLIFTVDWRTVLSSDFSFRNSWYEQRLFYNIVFLCAAIVFGIKTFFLWKKELRNSYKFLIAKGKIVKINDEKVKPDEIWHRDGIKTTVTVAVSENEKLPDFDVTIFTYEQGYRELLAVGESIVVLSFPAAYDYGDKKIDRLYFYKPWIDFEKSEKA